MRYNLMFHWVTKEYAISYKNTLRTGLRNLCIMSDNWQTFACFQENLQKLCYFLSMPVMKKFQVLIPIELNALYLSAINTKCVKERW